MSTPDVLITERTLSELRGFIARRVRDTALAKDIAQDVVLKVYSRFDQLKDSEKVTGWMYQIARNTITDHFRKASKSPDPREFVWEDQYSTLTDCVHGCLKEMMATLPDKYREALELAELGNMSQTELAEKLQISYSGAKSRVQRARQLLRERMDAQYRIEMDAYGNVVVCEDRVPCGCEHSPSD